MILSVCLSPSIDINMELDSLNVGRLNIVKGKSITYSGKGINVAFGVSRLGKAGLLTGFMYDENGTLFKQVLSKEKITSKFVWNPGRIRENYKIIDNRAMLTEINDVSSPVSPQNQKKLIDMVKTLSEKSNVCVISGSLPQGVDNDYYKRLFEAVNPKNIKIADASGGRLKSALDAGVDLVKPNKEELSALLNTEFESRAELLEGAKALTRMGAKNVLLSMGKDGAIITNGVESYFCKSVNVAVNSTVGAGDAMVSGAAVAMEEGKSLKEILLSGVAAGTAKIAMYGNMSFTKEKYDDIMNYIVAEEV